jgi:hypothetical protein
MTEEGSAVLLVRVLDLSEPLPSRSVGLHWPYSGEWSCSASWFSPSLRLLSAA